MNKLLVLQSDFGLADGAVAAMSGVAHEVDVDLKIYNLTHDITPTISGKPPIGFISQSSFGQGYHLCIGGRPWSGLI